MSIRPGTTLGPYRILSLIGSGGMGQVFKVEHTITKRIEAVKVLAAELESSQEQVTRFLREIEVHARLKHPNIIPVYTAFQAEDKILMVMEYVEGQSLERVIEQGRVPVATALDYVTQVLGALEYAHSLGIVHRDVSPANILITASGEAKLMDFGLAKPRQDRRVTKEASAVGSLHYMSPEQVRALPHVDGRTDLYSIGAILYHLVTGKPPFDSESTFTLMLAHVDQPPVAPRTLCSEVPLELSDTILTALAKSPAQRFQTAAEFRQTLESVRAGLPVQPAEPPRNQQPRRFAAAGSALAVFVTAFAGAVIYQLHTSTPETPPPDAPRIRPANVVEYRAPEMPEVLPALPDVKTEHVARPATVRRPVRVANARPAANPAVQEAEDEADTGETVADDADTAAVETPEPEPKKRHFLLRGLGKLIPGRLKGKPAEKQAEP